MPRGDEPEDDEPVFDGDEEIDSDNAFDSEDERRYGHAFKKDAPPGYGEGSDDDPESDFSGDDSDYDGVVSVLDLIEKKPSGILVMLDEEVRWKNMTDMYLR